MNKKIIILFSVLILVGLVMAVTTTGFYNSPTKNNYYSFNGSNYINISSSDSLNISNATSGITLSAWVKLDEYECYKRIVAKSHTSDVVPYTEYGLMVGCNSTGTGSYGIKSLRMELAGDGNQHFIHSTTSVENGVWYQVTATYNNSDGAKIYINGILDNSTLLNATSPPSAVDNITGLEIDTNDNPVSIGSSIFTSNPSDYFTGSIDEVKIFNRSLSTAEVLSLYNIGIRNESDYSTAIENLVAYYPLNDSTPSDYSGNSNDGINNGATSIQLTNDFVSAKNITFTGDQNKTFWVYVYKGANFTGATFNLSGNGLEDQHFSIPDSYSCTGNVGSALACYYGKDVNAVDGNFGTEIHDCTVSEVKESTVIENTTLDNLSGSGINWTTKGGYRYLKSDMYGYNIIYYWNYASPSWVVLGYSNCLTSSLTTENLGTTTCSFTIPSNGIQNNVNISIKTVMNTLRADGGTAGCFFSNEPISKYFEGEAVVFDIDNLNNPSVKINNTQIWAYSGKFSEKNNKTNDFSDILNTAINSESCDCDGCILDDTACSIPLIFNSEESGILGFSDINISWTEDVTPIPTINQPTGEKPSLLISYDVDIDENWEVDTCTYWVTRGASIEVSNTTVSGCSSSNTGTFIVSSQLTDYIFHFFVEDESGNTNYTNSSFSTKSDATDPPASGGGSTGTIIIGGDDWTMEASEGQGKFDVNLVIGTTQIRDIIFENLGQESRTLTLSCEDQEGDGCKFVTFEENIITLPKIADIKTNAKFKMTAPDGVEIGSYVFNIIATDDKGKNGKISVFLTVKETGFFSKLTARTESGFPYFLVATISFMLSMILALFITGKLKTKAKPFIALIISIGVTYLVVLIF